MESLLEERPTDTYMEESLSVLRELADKEGGKAKSIVDLCLLVAKASGGFFGFGAKVGDAERQLIEQIVDGLGEQAHTQFKKELG